MLVFVLMIFLFRVTVSAWGQRGGSDGMTTAYVRCITLWFGATKALFFFTSDSVFFLKKKAV